MFPTIVSYPLNNTDSAFHAAQQEWSIRGKEEH